MDMEMKDRLTLIQFPTSHFCLKARMTLDWKGLRYEKKTVYPLLQGAVQKLSGQRKVPVLLVNGRAIPDTTDIALYLDERYPDPPLLPSDSALARRALLWEDWADESLSFIARDMVYARLLEHPDLIGNFLPKALRPRTPAAAKKAAARLVTGVFTAKFGIDRYQMDRAAVRLPTALSLIAGEIAETGFLVGDRLSLADIAVAAGLDPLRLVQLAGDGPMWGPLFAWADSIRQACRASGAGDKRKT
jgi:glutathione S-transferase